MSNDLDPPELGPSDSQVRKTERVLWNTTPGLRKWLNAYARSCQITEKQALDHIILGFLEKCGVPNPVSANPDSDLGKEHE